MQDLPIGFDADGADAWAFQDVLADGHQRRRPARRVQHARPELGSAAVRPGQAARAPATSRSSRRSAAAFAMPGGLRIDHVMGLFRLFWIPVGMEPQDGALRPQQRARPAGDRRAREPARPRGDRRRGSRDGRGRHPRRADAPNDPVVPPALVREGTAGDYPEQALAAVTTHDLPTIAGLWTGSDVAAQTELGLAPERGRARARSSTGSGG